MWYQQMGMGITGLGIGMMTVFGLVAIWSIIWKGMALWRAARLGSKGWFIALLLINTAGILEIIYLYIITKPSKPVAQSNPR